MPFSTTYSKRGAWNKLVISVSGSLNEKLSGFLFSAQFFGIPLGARSFALIAAAVIGRDFRLLFGSMLFEALFVVIRCLVALDQSLCCAFDIYLYTIKVRLEIL